MTTLLSLTVLAAVVSAIKGAVLLACALALLPFLRRRPAADRHRVLAAALLGAALIPAWSAFVPALDVDLGGRIQAVAVVFTPLEGELPAAPSPAPSIVPRDPDPRLPSPRWNVPHAGRQDPAAVPIHRPPTTLTSGTAAPAPAAPRPFDWLQAFGAIWFAGAILGLASLAIGVLRLWRIERSAAEAPQGPWRQIAEEITRDYRLKRLPRLLQSGRPSILATCGAIRPAVLLPAGAGRWSEDRIRIVLAHEFAHIRRADWLVQLMAGVIRSVYWFNPLVWIVDARLRQESEQACDDAVLARGIDGADYAAHLLELARALNGPGRLWTQAASMARPSTLDRRFRALLDPGTRRTPVSRRTAAMLIVLPLSLAAVIAAVRAAEPSGTAPRVQAAAVQNGSSKNPSVAPVLTGPAALAEAVLSALLPQTAPALQGPEATSVPSLEGQVVRFGSNAPGDPIAGVTVELSRAQDAAPDRGGGVTGARTSSTGRGGPLAPASAAAKTLTVVTGDDGKFSFTELEPGEYRLAAVKTGGTYVPVEYGQRDPKGPGARIAVTATGGFRGIRLEMPPTGSIAGRITDGDGDPVANARVEAIALQYRRSEPRVDAMVAVNQPVMSVVQAVYTNDRGEYRLYWLTPGRYLVGARVEDPRRRASMLYTPGPGQTEANQGAFPPVLINRVLPTGERVEETYQLVFFGGHTDAQKALTVEVQPGMTTGAVDVAVDAGLTRARHIRGVVTNRTTGQPFAGASLRVVPVTHSPDVIVPSATSNGQGAFDIAGVAPGAYLLYAWSGETTASPPMAIEVSSRDVDNVSIVAGPAYSVAGRIAIEGRPNDPAVRNVRIHMVRIPTILGMPSGRVPQGIPAVDGAFTVDGLWPGRRLMAVNELPAGTYVKSILLGGRDVMNEGFDASETQALFDVVLGTDGASVEGRVLDPRLQPVVNAVVVLVPGPATRKRADLYKDTWSDGAGRFRFANVPPGEYTMFAWEYVDDGLWQDTEFMRREESRGRPVRIGGGAKENIDLTVLARPK